MENPSGEQTSEQNQQAPVQSPHTRLPPTAEQLAQFAASYHETKQKRKASEPFAKEEEAPARRIDAPQSTGIHNQRSLAVTAADQIQSALPALSGSSQEQSTADTNPGDDNHMQSMTSALSTNPDLRAQLRDEIRKEFELLCESRLAKRTAEVEAFWRARREERTKEVESYWREKLREAVSKDQDQNTRDLLEEIEKLKARLEKGPRLIKAAEERGRRQGELDGFTKLSRNPELKPSQDRLNFDFLMKEKDKEIAEVKEARDNWFRDARRYSQETNAKIQHQEKQIQQLQAQIQSPPSQPPPVPNNAEALIAEGRELQGRFDNQTQEFASLQEKCNQQAVDLANLRARLEHMSQESINRDQQLDAQSAQLNELSNELDKKTQEVSILRRESDRKTVELNDSSEELEKKTREISDLLEKRQRNLEELEENRQQAKARTEEIASIQTRHNDSESSNKEKDKKIASLRELLDSSSAPKSCSADLEEIKLLKEQLVEIQSLLSDERSENASLRDHQARREAEDLLASSGTGNAAPSEANLQLMQDMLEKEREKIEVENSSRENRVSTTLASLQEKERERRQMLVEELDKKDSELYDTQKRVRELEQQLLASSSSYSSQSSPQALPISINPSPPVLPAPPAAEPSPSPSRLRFLAPRSLLIVVFIFFFTFFAPLFYSIANPGLENEPIGLISRDDRLNWETWKLAAWERDEGVPTHEESWRRTQEVGQMGDWAQWGAG